MQLTETISRRSYPKLRLTEKDKVTANQRLAMRVAPLGNKELVETQKVEYTPTFEGEEEKDPDYEPSSKDEMMDDNYGEYFIINNVIVSILPTEFDRVSEVSKKKDYILDEAFNEKPL